MKVVFKKKYSYCFDRINPTTFMPMQEAEIDDSLAKRLIKNKIAAKVKAPSKKKEEIDFVLGVDDEKELTPLDNILYEAESQLD